MFDKSRTTLIRCPGGKLGSYAVLNSVTNIGGWAFHGCTGLTSVTIPYSVTSIGDYAFDGCSSLADISIPNSVTSIGTFAFRDCSSLVSVTIANSVTSIGWEVFEGCTSLSAITVEALNSSYSSVGGVMFDKSRTTLIRCPGGKPGSYTVPNSVTSIERNAFMGCTSLASVTIPNSVTSIGDCAFEGCTSLRGVYFQGNAPDLGQYLFADTSATIYYLPETVGWGPQVDGHATALWQPEVQTSDASFGVQMSLFGFTIDWASDKVVVVEAATDLTKLTWSPVSTNTLTGGTSYFSDPQWLNHPHRFYRVRAP